MLFDDDDVKDAGFRTTKISVKQALTYIAFISLGCFAVAAAIAFSNGFPTEY